MHAKLVKQGEISRCGKLIPAWGSAEGDLLFFDNSFSFQLTLILRVDPGSALESLPEMMLTCMHQNLDLDPPPPRNRSVTP